MKTSAFVTPRHCEFHRKGKRDNHGRLVCCSDALSITMPPSLMGALAGKLEGARVAERAAPARSWMMPILLADQLNSMAAAAASATADATEASAKLNEAGQKARRKSRELEAQFFGMHVEEVADIKKIFEEFDEDHSGGISLEELKKAIKSLKATICPEDRVVRATAGRLGLCPVPYDGTQRAHASLISAASRATKLAVFVLPAARRPAQLRKSIPKYTRKDFKDGKELDEDAFRKLILAVKTGALIEDVQKSDEEIRALFNKVTDCH